MREVDRALERLYGGQNRVHEARGATPPKPHVAVPPPTVGPSEMSLAWPSTVLALEQAHGPRFQVMANRLAQDEQHRPDRVILFTSCHRAEGRSTLVLTLARILAHRPGKTLLMDADLTSPSLARWLRAPGLLGLQDVVESRCSLMDAVIPKGVGGLDLLPLRSPVLQPKEFLASGGWTCLMARARREYDLVLLDGSPLFAGLSAALLHRSVDAAVLVVHRGLTTDTSIERAREVLEAGGLPVRGIAETFASQALATSGSNLNGETDL